MSSSDDFDARDFEVGRTHRRRTLKQKIQLDPIILNLRRFSDASNSKSDESPGRPDPSRVTPNSDNHTSEDSDSEPESSSGSTVRSEKTRRWRQSRKKATGTGRSRNRLRSARKGLTLSEEDQLDEFPHRKFHYSKYYAHYHRRANYGNFSFITALRRCVMATSTFTNRYHKEILMVLFCIASALASFRAGIVKTKTVGRPEPFFTGDDDGSELIKDLYGGEYIDLARKEIPYHPSFLFYYAHWDSESVEAKVEFLRVAKYFHETKPGMLKFFAINCWWPDGQCRQNYKSLSHFPIFVAHASSTSGTIYNGPIRAELMIRFLETIMMPFTRIDTDEELWRFRAQHDAIMLTSMNSTEADFDPSFNMYRQMALRNLEADPLSQIGFGLLIRRELGEKFYLATGRTISLVLFNEIHTAKWIPPEKGMKGPIGQVADWVTERTTKSPITWSYQVRNGFANKAISPGSVDISEEIMKRPLFLLVTRRYYPSAYSPFYSQLKQVALDYFNCNKSVNVTKLRRMTHKLNSEWMKLWSSLHRVCSEMYLESGEMSLDCQQMWEQLEHWNDRKRIFVRESLKNYENISAGLNLSGLSCRTSRPFQFIAIDPVDVPDFIKLALGKPSVDPSAFRSNTNRTFHDSLDQNQVPDPVAFIIDGQDELILPITSFNISDIARTIRNFSIESKRGTKNFPTSQIKVSSTGTMSTRDEAPTSTILNFTAKELSVFLETTKSPLLLMYSAQFCGFCTVTLAHYVRLAQFLKEFDLPVVLGKIDTYKHSLPTRLAPETIPTFVFFPGHNRSESRILSTKQPLTAQVLLKFLLSQLDPEIRVKISLRKVVSKQEGIQKSKANILQRIEKILSELVNDPFLHSLHEEEAPTDLEVDLSQEAITAWKYEVLEHLRSMQIRLDTE